MKKCEIRRKFGSEKIYLNIILTEKQKRVMLYTTKIKNELQGGILNEDNQNTGTWKG